MKRSLSKRIVTEIVPIELDDETIDVSVTATVYPPCQDSFDGPGNDWTVEILSTAHKNNIPIRFDEMDALIDKAVADNTALFVDAYYDKVSLEDWES